MFPSATVTTFYSFLHCLPRAPSVSRDTYFINHNHSYSLQDSAAQKKALFAHIENVKLLVLGMEQRLQTREEKLTKTIEKAEKESQRFEVLRKDVAAVAVDG